MEENLNRFISARILNLIADRELTAYQIMKALKIPSATFYSCMNSERDWSLNNLVNISNYFGVTLDYLIKGHPEQKFKTQNKEGTNTKEVYELLTELTQVKEELSEYKKKLDKISKLSEK
jgi:hypothetical protein